MVRAGDGDLGIIRAQEAFKALGLEEIMWKSSHQRGVLRLSPEDSRM